MPSNHCKQFKLANPHCKSKINELKINYIKLPEI